MKTLSLYNFLNYFVIFPLLYLFRFIKYLNLYITLRGTKLVYLDVPLSFPSNIQCNSISVVMQFPFYAFFFFLTKHFSVTIYFLHVIFTYLCIS